MNISIIKQKATEDIIVRLTFDGSFQRAKLYKSNASVLERKLFRQHMAVKLAGILNKIQARKRYTDKDHYKTLVQFTLDIEKRFCHILQRGQFRLGNAQKFLNLYWKISWLLKKETKAPIHCPFDSIVIAKLDKRVRHIKWTKFDLIADYKKLVEAAKIAAGSKTISAWELELYQSENNYKNLKV